jgi:hypothetical protein
MTNCYRTAKQIVDQTIELAGAFYAMEGYTHRRGFKYWESPHPQERLMWEKACLAQRVLTDTDPEDALSELDE